MQQGALSGDHLQVKVGGKKMQIDEPVRTLAVGLCCGPESIHTIWFSLRSPVGGMSSRVHSNKLWAQAGWVLRVTIPASHRRKLRLS